VSESDTYNGWEGRGTRASAYATWNVALWLDNEPGTYGDARALTREHLTAYRAASEGERLRVVRDLGDALKGYVLDLPDVDYDFDGVAPVSAVPYGPTANRDALGYACKMYELPARIVERVATLGAT